MRKIENCILKIYKIVGQNEVLIEIYKGGEFLTEFHDKADLWKGIEK